MSLKNNIIASQHGGVVILIAVMIPVLLTVLGITVDIGRSYAVQSKAQNAADAALIGAVSTSGTTNVSAEARRIFNANFTTNYMGTTLQSFTVTQPSPGQYVASVSVSVPTVVMQLFGQNSVSVSTTSRVNFGFQQSAPQSLELALVFDNSGNADTTGMRLAGNSMINILFGNRNTLNNIRVSIIPYDVAVNVGNNRVSWAQAAFVARYNTYRAFAGGNRGFLSNRNSDAPPNALVDVSDAAPTTDGTRFRTPLGYGPTPPRNPTSDPDYVSTNRLALMRFGLNNRNTIRTVLASMRNTTGNLRINVGMMWGWFTLSPNWQGRFTAGLPGIPANTNPLVSKNMVLVVTRSNNVYTGQPNRSNDDTTTRQMCAEIKSRGINLYVVGYGGGGFNSDLLRLCATGPNYFFSATNSAGLITAFNSIANAIQFDTIRLSQ